MKQKRIPHFLLAKWRTKRQLVTLIVSFSPSQSLPSTWRVGCNVSCPPVVHSIKLFSCHYGFGFTASGKVFLLSHFSSPSLCQNCKDKKDFCWENFKSDVPTQFVWKVSVLKRYGPWGGGKPAPENFTNGLFLKKEGFFFSFLRIMLTMMLLQWKKRKKRRIS